MLLGMEFIVVAAAAAGACDVGSYCCSCDGCGAVDRCGVGVGGCYGVACGGGVCAVGFC